MLQKNEHHSFTGMQRDLAISKHPANYLYDALNVRLTQREKDTLLTVSNEKGTMDTQVSISGDYLGHCLLNKYLVVFSKGGETDTTDSPSVTRVIDYIEKINLENNSKVLLFKGNLNFNHGTPIEAIGSFENENVQKIYWTDGYNQPRVINIQDSAVDTTDPEHPTVMPATVYTGYDFVNTLALKEEVTVKKMKGGGGMFAPGVIQYAFTYYHKYGQESNIFYTTPLIYISYPDRGGSPEDKINAAFNIRVENVDVDNFSNGYLRIYSIQRTSLNGTPITKRLQDISVADAPYISGSSGPKYITFTDTGTEGDTIDPTELLYKGGEDIVAQTIEQKDGTLFLGNIETKLAYNRNMWNTITNLISVSTSRRDFYVTLDNNDSYKYGNQLSAVDSNGNSVPCSGFKYGNYYRLGVQFQHKTGKWSDPLFIDNELETQVPTVDGSLSNKIYVPTFTATLNDDSQGHQNIAEFVQDGYIKVRGVVVFPEAYDRVVQCQGVANPTLKYDNSSYYQGSWFYRPITDGALNDYRVSPKWGGTNEELLDYTENTISYNPTNIRSVEIQGNYSSDNKFKIYKSIMTFDTPDVEFDTDLWNFDFTGTICRKVGRAAFSKTLSDINIQTESPTISTRGAGFTHKSFTGTTSYGIVSGLFYDDFVINDDGSTDNPKFVVHEDEKSPAKWLVYPWHKTGSLNNDFNRPANAGTRTAMLKKKAISNLRFAERTYWNMDNSQHTYSEFSTDYSPKLFSSDQLVVMKFGNYFYQGNVDTLLNPDGASGNFFSYSDTFNADDVEVSFDSDIKWKTGIYDEESEGVTAKQPGLWNCEIQTLSSHWYRRVQDVGEKYLDIVTNKEPVRMKYKTSPHIIIDGTNVPIIATINTDPDYGCLPVIEICTPGDNPDSQTAPYYRATMFGGTSPDALKANIWLPAGEPVSLLNNDGTVKGTVSFNYSYGDTYYQRYDCLKTYPFTFEDINQIVEIGSFMLETYVNIDGRYDRNRGQLNNLNMSPVNFNLLNPVYSQKDNFFTYKIMDSSFYENNSFPNQITWTKEKQAGADVDLWTNITLASTYDMDGSKGRVQSLNAWKDQIFCFQDKGVSNILFNSRVQIPTSDGVPIEISNSYKVDGYRYISDGIGCTNKWTIKETPTGIYFIDSVSNDLYQIGNEIANVTLSHNMKSWFRDVLIDRTLYDDVNHDVYVVNDDTSLCYSEILGQFTSFMSYAGISLIESYGTDVFTLKNKKLFKMFEGQYNDFFGTYSTVNGATTYTPNYEPWYLTFVSNGADSGAMDMDKIFSNIDYRCEFYSGGDYDTYEGDATLDYMRAWNEYQDTQEIALNQLNNGTGYKTAKHYPKGNPQKKFKIWRIQIPRAKKYSNNQWVSTNDRIRNPWCKITLGKSNNENSGARNLKAILQDLNVQYYL